MLPLSYAASLELTNAGFGGVRQNSLRPEITELASLAVDAGGEVLALLADSAAFHVAVDVQRLLLGVNILVVVALVRVAVAVARLALVRVFPVL